MLQNELKQQLKKSQLQKKIALVVAVVFLLTTILFGILLFSNNTQGGNEAEQFNSPKINQPISVQVRNISEDTINTPQGLSEISMIRKFDSLTYIIDTLKLSLVRARAKAQRDYSRYITASNYKPKKTAKPAAKSLVTKPIVEPDNLTYLINNAKKFAKTDCRKALAFLYAAKKITQIDETSTANKTTIDQMMNKCEDIIFNNE